MHWAEPLAIVRLANGEYAQAAQTLSDFADQLRLASWFNLSHALPAHGTETSPDPWPFHLLTTGMEHLYSKSAEVASLHALSGVIQVESSQLDLAKKDFQRSLDLEPDLAARPLIAWYLSELTNADVDPFPRREQIPVLFASEDGDDGLDAADGLEPHPEEVAAPDATETPAAKTE